MKSVNKVILIGLVGRDPDVKKTKNNLRIATFTLATTKKNKEKENVVQWHTLVAFGKTAELIELYVKKGSKLYVEGELQYQEYEKDGLKRLYTKVAINEMSFLSDIHSPCALDNKQKAEHSDIVASDVFLESDEVPF